MKTFLRFIKTNLFFLWLLYIIIVSVSSFFNGQTKSPISIHPTNQSASNYKYIFKDINGNYNYYTAGIYIDDIYVIAPNDPKNVFFTVEGKNYTIDNNIILDSTLTKNFIDSSIINNTEKAFKVTNIPQKTLLLRAEKFPFIGSFKAINYSYKSFWLILFSPLLVFSLLAYLFKNKFIQLFNFYRSFKINHSLPIKQTNITIDTFLIIIFILAVFFFIEYNTPYYFLQDDNYSQFYPYLISGLNAIYTNHTLPLYNFNQFNGTPNLGYTTYSYFNPILHVSYWFCLLFKNKYLLIEIFAYLNLVYSAVFINLILRLFNIRFYLRLLAISNIIFSGYVLVVLSSWYYVAPYVFFVTLLFYLALKIIKGHIPFSIKSSFWIGIICGLFIYGGNIQYWVYSLLFFTLMLLGGVFIYFKIVIKKILSFLFVLFSTAVIIGLPNIILGIIETKDLKRGWSPGSIWFADFWNYIVTIPNNESVLGGVPGSTFLWENQYHFNHIGIIGSIGFIASIIVLCLILIRKKYFNSNYINKNYIFIAFLCLLNIFFLLLSMGNTGILYRFQKFIPFINKFSLSFKYILFVVLISNLIGALLVESFLKLSKRTKTINLSLAFLLIFFILFHVKNTNFSFYKFGFNKNIVYDDSWIKADKQNTSLNKYLSIAPGRSHDISFSNSLNLNFATQFNLFALNGYEPLNAKVSNTLVPIFANAWKHHDYDIMRKMGINRLIIWKEKPYLIQNDLAESEYLNIKKMDSLVLPKNLVFENPTMAIYKIENADPLFFYYKNGIAYKDVRFERHVSGSSLTFNFLPAINADSLVINFDYNQRFIPYLNNHKLNKNLVRKDLYNRIVIDAKGVTNINLVSVKYAYF